MRRLDRTISMRNKVETRLKKCKKGGKTAIFLLVDSENFNSTSSVEKMAKELLKASKTMKDFYPVILVGGSSATDQMGMDRAVRILRRKTKLDSEIPTASMPDIIFMLLIFFMVTTVLREYSGLPISLPKAKRIEKLKSKRHTSHIWVSKDGLISIEDKLYASDGIRHVMYEKRVADPQLVVSLKADERAKMGLISSIHTELRKADALKLNYSTKTAVD